MAQITVPARAIFPDVPLCPNCGREVEVITIVDKFVHISCPACSFADLALAVYGPEFPDLPSAEDAIHAQAIS